MVVKNAWNGGESEGGAKSGRLKHQFSQAEGKHEKKVEKSRGKKKTNKHERKKK